MKPVINFTRAFALQMFSIFSKSSLTSPTTMVLLSLMLLFHGSGQSHAADKGGQATSLTDTPAIYVGAQQCVACHQQQYGLWEGSHHDLAMQPVNEQTVLGDFDNASFDYFGTVSRFYKKDNRFFVNTDGPDGVLTDYPIDYVFGVDPLQQYLIAFPGGRYQALSVAWDSRPKEEGGQRWFHLYPNEHIKHGDELHWTGVNQNWNYMCADCHSTNLEKNYDATSRNYQTTWSDIDVSCEACHGPGSKHVQWARQPEATGKGYANDDKRLTVRFNERSGVSWTIDDKTGNAVRSKPLVKQVELDICGRCHARREALSSDYRPGDPLLDHFRVSLLQQDLYHTDGQIDDEVYVYGSFLQSTMYAKGVTCSDCHDPHSLKLRAQGNGVCVQCHLAAKFDSNEHHHHDAKSTGGQCVNCHAPAANYMVVDPRRDHSFRIPRPDVSVAVGTPNACNQCHVDQSAQWALQKVTAWYGGQDRQHTAAAFHAANQYRIDAEAELLRAAENQSNAAIVRGTALSLLGNGITQRSLPVLKQAAGDSDPLVRMGAAHNLWVLPPRLRAQIGAPLLSDPLRVIRTEAARHLAGLPATALPASYHNALKSALAEYKLVQQFNADRPESLGNLANLALQEGDAKEAEHLYKQAIETAPYFIPAYANLADLYRAQGDETRAYALLVKALTQNEHSGALHHALGLAQIRQGERKAGIASLRRAYELAPEAPRYAYVYAVALHSQGRTDEALKLLRETHEKFETDREVLSMLVSIYRDRGDHERVRQYASTLLRLAPNNRSLQALIQESTK
jgi:predicted CXXCH cytochrome family protein